MSLMMDNTTSATLRTGCLLWVHHHIEVVAANLDKLYEREPSSFWYSLERQVVLVEKKEEVLQREQERAACQISI